MYSTQGPWDSQPRYFWPQAYLARTSFSRYTRHSKPSFEKSHSIASNIKKANKRNTFRFNNISKEPWRSKKYIKACLFFFYISHFIFKVQWNIPYIFIPSTKSERIVHLPARNSFRIITFPCYEKGDFGVSKEKSLLLFTRLDTLKVLKQKKSNSAWVSQLFNFS